MEVVALHSSVVASRPARRQAARQASKIRAALLGGRPSSRAGRAALARLTPRAQVRYAPCAFGGVGVPLSPPSTTRQPCLPPVGRRRHDR